MQIFAVSLVFYWHHLYGEFSVRIKKTKKKKRNWNEAKKMLLFCLWIWINFLFVLVAGIVGFNNTLVAMQTNHIEKFRCCCTVFGYCSVQPVDSMVCEWLHFPRPLQRFANWKTYDVCVRVCFERHKLPQLLWLMRRHTRYEFDVCSSIQTIWSRKVDRGNSRRWNCKTKSRKLKFHNHNIFDYVAAMCCA